MSFFQCVQITELEAQCNEANQEKQKNAELGVRVQELEAELLDKEQVRNPSYLQTTVCVYVLVLNNGSATLT